jgi:hypothetical protein
VTTRFVNQLRARGDVIQLVAQEATGITVRVEMPEKWDTVKLAVSPTASARSLKVAALAALFPSTEAPEAFVLKFRGWEVLDEDASLTDVGVVDGSILLLTHRRRQAVR